MVGSGSGKKAIKIVWILGWRRVLLRLDLAVLETGVSCSNVEAQGVRLRSWKAQPHPRSDSGRCCDATRHWAQYGAIRSAPWGVRSIYSVYK